MPKEEAAMSYCTFIPRSEMAELVLEQEQELPIGAL